MAGSNLFLISFFTFVSIIPTMMANIAVYDTYWLTREAEAKENTRKAFLANNWKEVLEDTNKRSHEVVFQAKGNSTRRHLKGKKYKGKCMATNPIDRCWRCQRNWADNRKRLASCALGFGRGVTGGKNGPFYIVTDSSDDVLNPKPGTLRHAVIQKEPLWIIFARSMTIKLVQELIMQGDKTIDARGANVHIAHGAGITIQFVSNVIIHGLYIHDIVSGNGGLIRDSVDHFGVRTVSDGDGISLFGASNIWIDHVSMRRCNDGLIDAVQESTAITISNCHFTDHNEVMLFGASDSYSNDQIIQITVAFNHFGKRLTQRMPRCRWGFIHVVNNDYTHWQMYAIGGSHNPTIISQGNRFIAPSDEKAKEVTHRNNAPESEWKNWTWRSEGDVMMNGAFFVESGDPDAIKNLAAKNNDLIQAAPGTQVTWMTRFAGALNCKVGKQC
ncbi:hypothetical protein RJ639_026660 [Escallonia herrerae]|uniref:Pectate lyase n=1 Tax=Escallonia herrerae TaxID=1293975 RepID=A0AA88UW60_9ASTE|nr:hypothetical protein RJ639_026660 [Escallonia herrerae]